MSVVVAVASLKGGVGKSSMSVLLASEAHARGWPVELVDLDPQRTSADWWGPTAHHMPRPTVEDIAAIGQADSFVLLDLPPGESPGAAVGLQAADRVVAVTGPSWVELSAIPPLERLVDLDGIIVTRVDGRRVLHKEAIDRLSVRYGDRLLGAVPLRSEVERAAAERRPPLRTSPAGLAAADILDRMASWRD